MSGKGRVSWGYWKDLNNQRAFFDKVASLCGVQQLSDWSSITVKHVLQCGGGTLLKYYNGSLLQALRAVYPGHSWSPWKMPSDVPAKSKISKIQHLLFRQVARVSPV